MDLKDPQANILVFDVGGSHASAALARGGSLVGRSSSALDSDGTADAILEAMESLGKKVVAECGLASGELSGVSLGMPNPFDYEQGISYMRHKYGNLYGHNLRNDLAGRFGVPPKAVTFVNDASAYLLGELHFGAAVGTDRVIGITLGTGVGSAFALRGKIITSGEGVPNEGYLWNIEYQGGIVEDFISTRGIRGRFKNISGEDIEVREIARLAPTTPNAMLAMQQFGEVLGTVLKCTCGEFRPDTIVLGGAISRSADLFLPTAQKQLDGTGACLRVSQLFDDAALLGASVEWHQTTTAAAGTSGV